MTLAYLDKEAPTKAITDTGPKGIAVWTGLMDSFERLHSFAYSRKFKDRKAFETTYSLHFKPCMYSKLLGSCVSSAK